MPAYLSMDCSAAGKAKSAAGIAAIYAEAYRHPMPSGMKYTENVTAERSYKNLYWQNPRWTTDSYIPDWKRAIETLRTERTPKGKKQRKIGQDAVLVRTMVFQVSPVYFFPKLEGWSQHDIDLSRYAERGPIDMGRVEAWKDAMFKHLQNKWGDNLLSLELHLDENSPHIHAHIVPVTNDGRLSAKDLFDGQKKIKAHIHDAANACKHLGLLPSQSRIENEERNRRNKQGDQWSKYADEERKRIVKELQDKENLEIKIAKERQIYKEVPQRLIYKEPEPPQEPEKPGIFASKEDKHEYEEKLYKYNKELAEYEARPARHIAQKKLIIDELNNHEAQKQHLKNERDTFKQENTALKQENEQLKKALQRAETERLRAIPITDILERMYSHIIHQDQKDKTIWRGDGIKLGIQGQKYIDNLHPNTVRGAGAIDLIKDLDQCSVKEAIAKLRDYYGTDAAAAHMAAAEMATIRQIVQDAPSTRPAPAAPARSLEKAPALRRWLVQEQRISPATADHLLDTGQIWADARANCIAPRPGGGYFARGTVRVQGGNKFKASAGSKKAGCAVFNGSAAQPPKKSIICEGITDGLALADRFPDARIFIVGGNLRPDLPPDMPQPVFFAFDADTAGASHFRHYQQQCPDAQTLPVPDGYPDWAAYHQAQSQLDDLRDRQMQRPTPRPR